MPDSPLHQLATILRGEAYQSCVIVGSDVISCSFAGIIRLSSNYGGPNAAEWVPVVRVIGKLSDGPEVIAAAYRRAIAGTVDGVDPYGLAASA